MSKLKQIYSCFGINKKHNKQTLAFSCINGFKIERRVWEFQFRCPGKIFYKTDLNPRPQVQFLSVTRRAERDFYSNGRKEMICSRLTSSSTSPSSLMTSLSSSSFKGSWSGGSSAWRTASDPRRPRRWWPRREGSWRRSTWCRPGLRNWTLIRAWSLAL